MVLADLPEPPAVGIHRARLHTARPSRRPRAGRRRRSCGRSPSRHPPCTRTRRRRADRTPTGVVSLRAEQVAARSSAGCPSACRSSPTYRAGTADARHRPTPARTRGDWPSTASCHHTSRPACIGTGLPVRLTDDDPLDARQPAGERLVGRGFQLDDVAAAPAAIGGDHELRARHPRCDPSATAPRSRRTPPSGWRRCARTRASQRRLPGRAACR